MALSAKQLFEAGQVTQAAKALSEGLRNNPTDVAARSFLFELLCFSGDLERAQKQLNLLTDSGEQAKLGAMLYFSAIYAEKQRQELFKTQAFPQSEATPTLSGRLNGKPFSSISDADPDIGARLEVFGAGSYLWIQFEHISSIRIEAPKRLRDTLWLPAFVNTGPKFKGQELGEVLLPAIYPLSWQDSEESVWLGRQTVWVADEKGKEFPLGQKTLLVDGEEFPFLEIRTLEIDHPEAPETDD